MAKEKREKDTHNSYQVSVVQKLNENVNHRHQHASLNEVNEQMNNSSFIFCIIIRRRRRRAKTDNNASHPSKQYVIELWVYHAPKNSIKIQLFMDRREIATIMVPIKICHRIHFCKMLLHSLFIHYTHIECVVCVVCYVYRRRQIGKKSRNREVQILSTIHNWSLKEMKQKEEEAEKKLNTKLGNETQHARFVLMTCILCARIRHLSMYKIEAGCVALNRVEWMNGRHI